MAVAFLTAVPGLSGDEPNPWVRHLTFNFLGLQLVLMAFILLLGNYTGYRLLELRRFKPLTEDSDARVMDGVAGRATGPHLGALRARGVVAAHLNRRNIGYISKYNDRRLYPLVDGKQAADQAAVSRSTVWPRQEMIGKVASQFEVERVVDMVRDRAGFVIKPAKGSGGKGILVIEHHDGEEFCEAQRRRASRVPTWSATSPTSCQDFIRWAAHRMWRWVEGFISFNQPWPSSPEGVPDIRVMVFKGYPVMAMMRLSTAAWMARPTFTRGQSVSGWISGQAGPCAACSMIVHSSPTDTGHDLFSLKVPRWTPYSNWPRGVTR